MSHIRATCLYPTYVTVKVPALCSSATWRGDADLPCLRLQRHCRRNLCIRIYLVALTPPKVTLLAPVKLSPVITTLVPTGPLVGEKLEIVGVPRKFTLLVKVRLGVVTLTLPVVAPLGTVVLISEFETGHPPESS